MLAYTTYSKAGGVGKTTLASNLADAHTQRGRDVLVIDLDPQEGSLTYLLGTSTSRDDSSADNLVRHLIDHPRGAFEDLIHETPYGFDIVPSHNMLESLPSLLAKAEEIADDIGDSFVRNDRLRQVLRDADIPNKYDTLIVDPPATAGPHLYNALTATQSVVLPVELTGKGVQSIKRIEDIATNLSGELGLDFDMLAVVPNGVRQTTNQEKYLQQLREYWYYVPVALRERSSLFEGCWEQRCTAFHYVTYHRDRRREHEVETLDKLRRLAAHIEEVGDQ
jgi:chromosome partitioning protein